MSGLTREETTKLYLEKNDAYSQMPIKRGTGASLEVATAYRSVHGWYYVSVGDNIHASNSGRLGDCIKYKSTDALIEDGWIID